MEYTLVIASEKLPYLTRCGLKWNAIAPLIPIEPNQTYIRLRIDSGSQLTDLIYCGIQFGMDTAFASAGPTVEQLKSLWAEQKARLNESLPVTA